MEPQDNNAPIQGYVIFYEQPAFAGGERIAHQVQNDELAQVLELLPGVEYNFTVIAFNAIGNSIESEPLLLRTLEEGNHLHIATMEPPNKGHLQSV